MNRRVFFLCLLPAAAAAADHKRIVSTAPSITEMLFRVGAGDLVAGVTQYCRYPPEAQKLPKIGTYIQPDIEAIAALKPDLVIIQRNPIELARKLERVGLRVLEVHYDTVLETYQAIAQVAEAAGRSERGHKLVQGIRAELDGMRSRTVKLPRRKMAFIVGRSPGAIEGIVAVGRASYLNEIIEIAGGRNAFADATGAYPKITLEELVARNPDVIVDMGEMADTVGVTDARKQAVVAMWGRMSVLKAVRDKRVYAVAADYYVVPGPRMVDAARAFARMLHPEAGF